LELKLAVVPEKLKLSKLEVPNPYERLAFHLSLKVISRFTAVIKFA